MRNVLVAFLVIVGLLCFKTFIAYAKPAKCSATGKSVQTKLLKGTKLKNKRVTLRAGYEFVRETKNRVAVRQISTGVISGSFNCDCKNQGSCELLILGTSISCVPDTCSSSCFITTIVKEVVIHD